MMNTVELITRVTGGTYEVRATANRVSDVSDDMRRFVRNSTLPVEPFTATPHDDVLLHMFGIATNHLLNAARRAIIPGPSWDSMNQEGNQILAGLLSVGFSSASWLSEKTKPKNLQWIVQPANIVPNSNHHIYSGIVPGRQLTSYHMPEMNSFAISVLNTESSDLFSTTGMHGRVMFKYPSHFLFPSQDANIRGINIGAETYEYKMNTYPCDAIRLNGVSIRVNEWMSFEDEFTLRSFAPFEGVLFITFDISAYLGVGSPWFTEVAAPNVPTLAEQLPPFPGTLGKWATMYTTAVRAFGAENPALIPSSYLTQSYVDLILLLNSHFV